MKIPYNEVLSKSEQRLMDSVSWFEDCKVRLTINLKNGLNGDIKGSLSRSVLLIHFIDGLNEMGILQIRNF